jgi:serpin B
MYDHRDTAPRIRRIPMRAIAYTLVIAAVLFTSACPAGSGGSAPDPGVTPGVEDIPALVTGNTMFALDIIGVLSAESPSGNLFFSPFSISTALGMTYAGSDGATADQMAEVLGFSLSQADLHESFHGLLEKLSEDYRKTLAPADSEPLVLEIANALWVEETFPLLASYTDLVEEKYDAEARNVDFIGDPEGSRITINDWVADKTRDRIRDLIPQGVIDGGTRVVLTNAVYFKGSWMYQFNDAATSEGDWHGMDNTVTQVPMMHQTESFDYGAGYGCSAISLPYSDGMSSMLIMLPDGDIGEFESNLDQETLDAIRDGLFYSRVQLFYSRVQLTMPSFEFTSSFGLKETLESMGMTDAFDPASADFTGFTGAMDLYISAVIHKAFVKVDETGTEAAAATAVVMALTSAPPQDPVILTLDRPFLFMVVDDLTGSILFMGRVADPSV